MLGTRLILLDIVKEAVELRSSHADNAMIGMHLLQDYPFMDCPSTTMRSVEVRSEDALLSRAE